MVKQLIIESSQLRPTRDGFRVLGVFNPSVVRHGDKFVMIARVAEELVQPDEEHFHVPYYTDYDTIAYKCLPRKHPDYDYSDLRIIKNGATSYLTSISHFRVARSNDGVHFEWDAHNFILPENTYEEYGIEDPRITLINGTYYITYTAVSRFGVNVGLMRTDNFRSFERLGLILHADNKDCAIFPEPIGGRFYALHRPSLSHFGSLDIWLAESENLLYWGNHNVLEQARIEYRDSARVGAGAVPIATEHGWLVIYHSADAAHRYHLCAMVLDKNNPSIVKMRPVKPLVEPSEPFERSGFLNDVVFTCGALQHDGYLWIYYGVCDEHIALCKITHEDVFATMEAVSS